MRTVTILTHSYLNGYSEGEAYSKPFGGGLERYIFDLCGVIQERGWRAVVYQLSYFRSFETTYNDVSVRGFAYELNDIAGAFERMAAEAEGLIIYGSCLWHPIRYVPGSIGICHGVSWDWHDMSEVVKADVAVMIQRAVNGLERIVTVDSHFQTYCRSCCSYDDAERLELLPNAVDTAWFTPRGELEDDAVDDGPEGDSPEDVAEEVVRLGVVTEEYAERILEERVDTLALAAEAGDGADDWASVLEAVMAEVADSTQLEAVMAEVDNDTQLEAAKAGADDGAQLEAARAGADDGAQLEAARAGADDGAQLEAARAGADDGASVLGAAGNASEPIKAAIHLIHLPELVPGRLRLLYPRRLSYERGIVPMMLIADRLLAEMPMLTVEFAGELVEGTPVALAFYTWLKSHPYRDRIEHHTYAFSSVRDAYRAADVAVIPTVYSEGTSLSCLEAMSCGVAIVATNVGGLNDLITDGFNGRLVPPTENALYAAVRELLMDEDLRQRYGADARRTAYAFDIGRWQHRWGLLLEEQFQRRDAGS
ncbi:glycosyltransferase [Paenibacillus sp. CF384]|uniref:glycosyltransferase n=1 Tax=Paenibacillus sp. CF384 TaxID=1884382 RepID=UPI000894FBFC|nr:glycosyltransferase family 4 protein [Paenibacillus sp. CF384]SDX95497.1 Glycosyl transferases group 1 [Paenibacillus sp. CF384]